MHVDIATVQPLLQRALNIMETASCWQRKAAKRAHIVGLQGEKRRLRYLSREAGFVVDWTEHKAYDVIKYEDGKGLDICAQAGTADVSSLICPMSTMNGIVEKLWKIYYEIHAIANELVVAKFRKFAERLYKYADKLFDILGELQRAQCEYEMANYEYHHISRYQVGWENTHDEYECEEEKQGYKEGL